MNPFEKSAPLNGTYVDSFKSQINRLSVGESVKMELHGLSVFRARPLIKYACDKMEVKAKTKKDETGALWLKRVG